MRSVYQPQWGERGLLDAAEAGVSAGRQQRPEGAGGGLGRGAGWEVQRVPGASVGLCGLTWPPWSPWSPQELGAAWRSCGRE